MPESSTSASAVVISTPQTSAAPSPAAQESAPPVSSSPIATSPSPATTPPVATSPSLATTTPSVVALPAVDVAGVNVPGCRSSHRPVVLLHGSFSTVRSNFSALVPAVLAAGRCVYGVNYGDGGVAAVTSSAGQAAALMTAVLADTGASSVDVIAYSQGGLVLRTALRLNGLADKVSTAVLIAPSWNGTSARAAASLPASLCPACADQVADSPLLQRLRSGGDLDGSVRYAEISSSSDIVVTPVSSQVPSGPADRVRSVVVEKVCPALVTDHIGLPGVRGVIDWAVAALDTDGRPPDSALTC